MQYKGHELADSQFLSAKNKRLILRAWERFLKGGLQFSGFTKRLYQHLHLHCSFIAHYDRHGFCAEYFVNGGDTVRFLGQFDARKAGPGGLPVSVEYGGEWWAEGDYADVNQAMIKLATPYIPELMAQATGRQRAEDLIQAAALLAKHNVQMPDATP